MIRRLKVLGRLVAAVPVNYAFSAGLVALGSVALPSVMGLTRGEAVLLSSMLGFVFFLVALILIFKKSMGGLHTWVGTTVGALLFVIFWMGSLTVFDQEIDRWMMPESRRLKVSAPASVDAVVRPAAERLASESPQWVVLLPTDRSPTLRLRWSNASDKEQVLHLDPATGANVNPGTRGGTGFIYPFHYRLNIAFKDVGPWLVGLAAMSMLAALVSGVIIHKKIFSNFFTFRPRKRAPIAVLDLHNLAGVLALPFCFFMPLSGLIIAFATYFPSGWQAAFSGNNKAFRQDAFGIYTRPKANTPGTLSSLDEMLKKARSLWGNEGRPYYLRVWHPGDANSYVEVRRLFDDRIARDSKYLFFDAGSGALIARADDKPVKKVQRFITGLHMLWFTHWTLRWLYFLGGLTGCAVIATGLLFWLEKRRPQHEKSGHAGIRLVEALAVGIVPGIIFSTVVFFIANRVLPPGMSLMGIERETWEMGAFHATWVLSFAHGAWRGRAAWAGQCRAISLAAVAAVLLNWATTGDHLLGALSAGLYSVAGMDALLLAGSAAAWGCARRLKRRASIPGDLPLAAPAAVSPREAEYA